MTTPSSEDFSDLFESDAERKLSRFWRASESPVESFSDAEGADESGNWPVRIVGEEVDHTGEVRCVYKLPILLALTFITDMRYVRLDYPEFASRDISHRHDGRIGPAPMVPM